MTKPTRGKSKRSTDEDRAQLAQQWSEGLVSGSNWITDPTGLPRAAESEQISLRLPKNLLAVIRAMGKRRGLGYQILLKDWIHDRARLEAERELRRVRPQDPATVIVALPIANLGLVADDAVDSADRVRHLARRGA